MELKQSYTQAKLSLHAVHLLELFFVATNSALDEDILETEKTESFDLQRGQPDSS